MFAMLIAVLVVCGFAMMGGIMGGAFECDGKDFGTGALIGCLIFGFLMLFLFAGINSVL